MTFLLFCNLNTKPVCNTIKLPWSLYKKHSASYFPLGDFIDLYNDHYKTWTSWYYAHFETWLFYYGEHYETSLVGYKPTLRHFLFPTTTILRHDHFETWHFSYSNHYETWPFWDMTILRHDIFPTTTIMKDYHLETRFFSYYIIWSEKKYIHFWCAKSAIIMKGYLFTKYYDLFETWHFWDMICLQQ